MLSCITTQPFPHLSPDSLRLHTPRQQTFKCKKPRHAHTPRGSPSSSHQRVFPHSVVRLVCNPSGLWLGCCVLKGDGATTGAAASAAPQPRRRPREGDGRHGSAAGADTLQLVLVGRCLNVLGEEASIRAPPAEPVERAHPLGLRDRLRERRGQGQMQHVPFQDHPGRASGEGRRAELAVAAVGARRTRAFTVLAPHSCKISKQPVWFNTRPPARQPYRKNDCASTYRVCAQVQGTHRVVDAVLSCFVP